MPVDRRAVFAIPALAAAAAGPMAASAADQPPPTPAPTDLSRRIARFVARTRYEDLPAAAAQAARRSILDAVGVSLAASGLEPSCLPFVELARMEGGRPQATVLGAGFRTSAAGAAMANGAFAHALDYEDVHDASGMHPNAAVVPAALAIAQAEGGVSGKDFIAAVAVGCDLACRLGLARTENLNKYGWYFPPIASAFGATATAARLLHLDEQQTLDAMSLTLCQTSCSSEITNAPDSAIRAIRDSFAAQTAIRAAYLAKAGVRGFDQPFEGSQGFFTMYAHGRYKPAALLDGLGEQFHGQEVSFKAWPACRGTHLYIQAMLELNQAARIDPAAIERIDVVVTDLDRMLCELPTKKAPTTAIDAKFSIPFAIGLAAADKAVTLGSFDDAQRRRPEVLKVAGVVSHTVDDKRARLASEGGGEVLRLTMRGGEVRAAKVQNYYGSTSRPMPDAEFLKKFTDCAGHAQKPPSPAAAARTAEQILALESLRDVRTLTALRA